MDIPAAVSISWSASTKGNPSRAASRRPTVVLPTPMVPTSTIERSVRTSEEGRGRAIAPGLYTASLPGAKGARPKQAGGRHVAHEDDPDCRRGDPHPGADRTVEHQHRSAGDAYRGAGD